MKKVLSLLMVLVLFAFTGCGEKELSMAEKKELMKELKEELMEEEKKEKEEPKSEEKEKPESSHGDDGTKGKIAKSTTYKGNNALTFFLADKVSITDKNRKDSIYLGTDAKESGGEMQWKDSNYWTLAVMVDEDEDGDFDYVYNLYYGDMQGRMYAEVNEYYIGGKATPVITAYIFDGEKREIREYTFDGECFVETITYTTEEYSTGGVNNIISSLPEYLPY